MFRCIPDPDRGVREAGVTESDERGTSGVTVVTGRVTGVSTGRFTRSRGHVSDVGWTSCRGFRNVPKDEENYIQGEVCSGGGQSALLIGVIVGD